MKLKPEPTPRLPCLTSFSPMFAIVQNLCILGASREGLVPSEEGLPLPPPTPPSHGVASGSSSWHFFGCSGNLAGVKQRWSGLLLGLLGSQAHRIFRKNTSFYHIKGSLLPLCCARNLALFTTGRWGCKSLPKASEGQGRQATAVSQVAGISQVTESKPCTVPFPGKVVGELCP